MAVKEKQKSICPEETVFGNGTCGKAQAEGKDAWLYRFCVGESAIERLGVLFLNFQMAFSNPILSLHIFDMAVGMITTVVIKAMVYLKGKNAKKFRQGEEYGSARWSA